jgi:hypothetical protein
MPAQENVLTRTGDFIKWFLPKIEKFRRNYKFLFGDRLAQIQLDIRISYPPGAATTAAWVC